MMALEIYTIIGTTAQTITVEYTNQAGTTGRTSPAVAFGGTGDREASRFVMVPLQLGDTGGKAVAGVTLSGSTGTAGDFGVTLFKPLFVVPGVSGAISTITRNGLFGGDVPEVIDDAALFFLARSASTGTGTLQGTITLIEA